MRPGAKSECENRDVREVRVHYWTANRKQMHQAPGESTKGRTGGEKKGWDTCCGIEIVLIAGGTTWVEKLTVLLTMSSTFAPPTMARRLTREARVQGTTLPLSDRHARLFTSVGARLQLNVQVVHDSETRNDNILDELLFLLFSHTSPGSTRDTLLKSLFSRLGPRGLAIRSLLAPKANSSAYLQVSRPSVAETPTASRRPAKQHSERPYKTPLFALDPFAYSDHSRKLSIGALP